MTSEREVERRRIDGIEEIMSDLLERGNGLSELDEATELEKTGTGNAAVPE